MKAGRIHSLLWGYIVGNVITNPKLDFCNIFCSWKSSRELHVARGPYVVQAYSRYTVPGFLNLWAMGHRRIFDGPRPGSIDIECILKDEPLNRKRR